jgi:hypothetical protein
MRRLLLVVLLGAVAFLLVRWLLWTTIGLLLAVVAGWLVLSWINKRIDKGKLWPFFKQPEGTLCHIVRGGQFCRAYFSMPGAHVDANGYIVADTTENPGERPNLRRRLFGNLRFISVLPYVALRKKKEFRWVNPGSDGETFV